MARHLHNPLPQEWRELHPQRLHIDMDLLKRQHVALRQDAAQKPQFAAAMSRYPM